MADDFHVGSGNNWWDTSRNSSSSSVTASVGLGWTTSSEPRSSAMDSDAPSISGNSNLLFHQKIQDPNSNPDLQIMGLGLNSHQTIDWNPNLIGEKPEISSFRSSMLQEQWRQPIAAAAAAGSSDNSTGNIFKQSNRGFSLDNQHEFNSSGSTEATESYNSDPMIGYGSPSAILLQGLLASDQDNRNYAFPTNYGMNSNDTWNKFPHQYMNSPLTSSSNDQSQQFTNSVPFWNSSGVTNDVDVRPGFFQPTPSPATFTPPVTFEEKPKMNTLEGRDLGTMGKKNNNNITIEPSNKRARSEVTPSPLPAFKVRKEKMGDRITALQQLVSPFGKTDTASVLSEAIESIKLLHEQVGVLSSPYMKNGTSMQQKQQNRMEKSKEAAVDGGGGGGGKQDLRSRGLCLVPVSSTFPVTHEPTVDYWNPTFGGNFR
ncbi:transcription factor bHLH123-like isoform X2 [Impatiens glandulifera]|uniref:transcription factor bHLH123-like isoform X2 n=1 Tax=Impatiens glandulifera TaxID=253017 RepID=UPI001FB05D51|nr:transcription factor bHLH123-like isoform X2 [Impatiens glandulifera]